MYNVKLQKLKILNIWLMTIDIWSSWNFASIEDIRRKYNSIINLLKFTSNKKKILNGVVILVYNQVYCQNLSKV